MDTQLIKRTKIVLFFILTIALLGGVGFYWRSRQITPRSLVGEKQVEIVENPDGSKTFYNYVYNYKFTVPEGWEEPRLFDDNPGHLHLSNYDSGIWTNINIIVSREDRQSTVCKGHEKTVVVIFGQEAVRCDYKAMPPELKGAIFYLNRGELFYVITVEPVEAGTPPQILNYFEFLQAP